MTMHAKLEHIRTTSERLARARRERKSMPRWEAMGRALRQLPLEWVNLLDSGAVQLVRNDENGVTFNLADLYGENPQ